MKKIMGLDLGTKTLGVALSDKTGMFVFPNTLIRFNREDYDDALRKVLVIIKENDIEDIAFGVPYNMDGSKGFAYERSINFISKLREKGLNVYEIDERLSTVESQNHFKDCNVKSINYKDKIDMEAACIILETYLRKKANEK